MSTLSTTPVTTPTFAIGTDASKSLYMEGIDTLVAQGNAILESLSNANTKLLVEFNTRLSAVNARRQRSNRLPLPGVYANFSVADMFSIDQGNSSATIRIDSQMATLKQRSHLVTASISSNTFSSNLGTVQALDNTSTLWTVTTDGTTPIGTFNIELNNSVNLSVVIIDIAPTQSTPTIVASASPDGITYTQATTVVLSGYRISAWFSPMEVKYFTLQITPSLPDDPNGFNFTFGITDFDATGIEYSLQSLLVTKDLSFTPASTQAVLIADTVPSITYFLSLADNPYFEITPNTPVDLPGVSAITVENVSDIAPQYIEYSTSLHLTGGMFVTPSVSNGYVYLALNSGITQTTGEPTWPTTVGTTIVSGEVTFTTYLNGTYAANSAYPEGMVVVPNTPNGFVYKVITTGITDSSTPAWPTTVGTSITIGTATFICQFAGGICTTLPSDVYLNTVSVISNYNNTVIPVVPGLAPSFGDQQQLLGSYVGLLEGGDGTWQPYIISSNPLAAFGATYTVNYICGPSTMNTSLQVQFNTEDIASSPVFTGATLQQY